MTDEYYFEEDGGEASGHLSAGDGAPAPHALDRRALLQSLADAGGEFGAAAALALEGLIEREDRAALAAAQVALAAEQSPRTIAQIMGELERQKALGLDADQDELTAAHQAVADLQAGLRAEVEARLASELQAQIDGLYKFHIDAGDGDERAQNEVDLFLADYRAMLAIDLETGGDLIDQNERWNAYLEEDGNLRRERQVIEQIGLEDFGYEGAVIAAAQEEMDGIIASRIGAVVGGVDE